MISESYNGISTDFNETFKLGKGEGIGQFFPTDKNSVRELVTTKLRRAAHFIETGVVINEKELCKWADTHSDKALTDLLSGKAVERKVIRHQHGMVIEKPSFFSRLKDALKFLGEFIRHPTTVGAILPSSQGLAKEIVSEIPKDLKAEKRLILEVGPGTGIFSDKIIKRMNPNDVLHLVEFDKEFADQLTERYKHIPNVKVFHASILDHTNAEKYNYIVSGLPLNGFKVDFVKQVFTKFTDIIKDKGKISYFEYLGIPEIKLVFSNKEERENLKGILDIKKKFHEDHMKGVGKVFFNAPCARVLHHEIKAKEKAAAAV